MRPFARKVRRLQRQGRLRGVGRVKGGKGGKGGEWKFVRKWKTGLKEETLEEMSEQGGRDAEVRGGGAGVGGTAQRLIGGLTAATDLWHLCPRALWRADAPAQRYDGRRCRVSIQGALDGIARTVVFPS